MDGIEQLCAKVEDAATRAELLEAKIMHAIQAHNKALDDVFQWQRKTDERLATLEKKQDDIGRILRIVSASHRDLQRLMSVWADRINDGK